MCAGGVGQSGRRGFGVGPLTRAQHSILGGACRWLCLSVALLTACAAPAPQSGGSRLVMAMAQEPASLNPLTMSGPATAVVVPLLYSYLLTLDEHDNLQPDVAREIPSSVNNGISADGLLVTYHLRHDVTWHDGHPLTARDIVFTFEAIMNPRNNVVSRSGYDDVARVEAAGQWTVKVHLRQRYAPILSTFLAPNQNYAILPAHLLASRADLNQTPFNASPIGSGPYRVVAWRRGDQLSLRRNIRYYAGPPAIENVDVKFVADSTAILNQLRTHEVGMTLVADPALLAQYRSGSVGRVVRAGLAGGGQLFFNLANPIVGDVRVRRALVQAVDFGRLVREATRGAQTYAYAARSLFSWGYDPSVTPPPYDPHNAARLLDAAGWRRSAGGIRRRAGRPLALQLALTAGNSLASSVGVLLQQELTAVGVQLTLHAYTASQLRAPASQGGPLYGGRYQLGFIEIYTPADPDTGWLFGCAQFPPNGFNISRYCDPVSERATRAGASTYDRALRRRFAKVVQRQVLDELPVLPLWQQNSVDIIPPGLRNFRPAEESPVWNAARWSY